MNEEPHDVSMIDEDEQRDEVEEARLPLSAAEQQVLDLYDQLQQLSLEIAIINAQSSYQPGNACYFNFQPAAVQKHSTLTRMSVTSYNGNDTVSEETQRDLLEARANFRLRNDVVESVMTANPILKAVHNGTNASPAER
jgi:multidrug resistance efflux pump